MRFAGDNEKPPSTGKVPLYGGKSRATPNVPECEFQPRIGRLRIEILSP
jgi:hypothetical protein